MNNFRNLALWIIIALLIFNWVLNKRRQDFIALTEHQGFTWTMGFLAGAAFRIFPGSEVDILKDGSLAFSDAIMAQLDYVVASVHNVFNLPETEMTKRIIRAIENPHVTMLGHLTGRLLLEREPYKVNVHAVIDALEAALARA